MNGSQVSERPKVRDPRDDDQRPAPIASQNLLQGRREVWIDHDGTLYCLKATSAGRLYLTK